MPACTKALPKHGEVIGTVTLGESETGALVKLATTGAYVKVTNGHISVLNQTHVQMKLDAIARQVHALAVEMVEVTPA